MNNPIKNIKKLVNFCRKNGIKQIKLSEIAAEEYSGVVELTLDAIPNKIPTLSKYKQQKLITQAKTEQLIPKPPTSVEQIQTDYPQGDDMLFWSTFQIEDKA